MKARGEAGIQVIEYLLKSDKNPGRNPRMGKGLAVATQIEASGFGVDDRALKYALSDRKRTCVLSLFGVGGGGTKTAVLFQQS